MKTQGQRLYEYEHPSKIMVVPVASARWHTVDDIMLVPNPKHHPAWELLTQQARDAYESRAVGHYLFTEERKHAKST